MTEARDGLEALQLARGQRPDLIVADAALPELDGLELCEAVRREPTLRGLNVILMSDGEPPQAVWAPEPPSKPLVDAALDLLASRVVEPTEASSDSPDEAPILDPVERENTRAQSTVAMYRDPANRVARGSHPIWRLRTAGGPREASAISSFAWELRVTSRILGAGFVVLVAATLALIAWRLVSVDEPAAASQPELQAPPVESEAVGTKDIVAEPLEPKHSERQIAESSGLRAFSGTLREGVDSALGAVAGQGALELDGPPEVHVTIDGIERGALPLTIVLDQGIHAVRYAYDGDSTDRFYFVKDGFTRVLVVMIQPGGFVDAR